MKDTNVQIGVLTYAVKHRKTYDTLCLLKTKGYENVVVYAAPYYYKKKFCPLYQHRPELIMDYPEIWDVCRAFNYKYILEKNNNCFSIEKDRVILLCGAGILNASFVENHKIINAHPGYLPYARGLDALKWAVFEEQPIGVTTHFLGKEIDAGEIIDRTLVPIQMGDTFHAVAQRVYETEINMLVNAIEKINEPHQYVNGEDYILHRRMSHEIEKQMMIKFDELKKKNMQEKSDGI